MAATGRFKPGESGNPKGRPRKAWALTQILETKGGHTIGYFDRRVSNKHLIAELLWQYATTGKVLFSDGRELIASSPDEWLRVVQYIYNRVDGPPPQKLDLEHSGDMHIVLMWDNENIDDNPTEPAPEPGDDSQTPG